VHSETVFTVVCDVHGATNENKMLQFVLNHAVYSLLGSEIATDEGAIQHIEHRTSSCRSIKGLKGCDGKCISELQSVTCHMRSYRVF